MALNERDRGNDEESDAGQATTSKESVILVHEDAYKDEYENLKDLRPIDFNSADPVRQAMKAYLAGKSQPPGAKAVSSNTNSLTINELGCSHGPSAHSSRSKVKEVGASTQSIQSPHRTEGKPKLKRRKKQPNAVPDKKIKEDSVSNLYIGKLSNVVPFQRYYLSESD